MDILILNFFTYIIIGGFMYLIGRTATLKMKNEILEKHVEILARKLDVEFFDREEMDKEIKEFMAKCEMIKAVKLYREKTGAGLIEAKQYVENV